MKRLDIANAKLSVVFPEGKLPAIDPADPAFVLVLGGLEIQGQVNPKAARKLAQHRGGAVLQGKLVAEGGPAEPPRRGVHLDRSQGRSGDGGWGEVSEPLGPALLPFGFQGERP